jgi:RNA polymerase sigma-70 factor (ECF subfamily)
MLAPTIEDHPMEASLPLSTPALARISSEPATPELVFDEVYEAHVDFVWRGLRRLGVPEAELDDALQDTFVVVHRRLADFEAKSSVKTWIFGIALRVARTHRRTRARRPTTPLDDQDEPPSRAADPAATALDREAVRVLHPLLDELHDHKREVFVLAELEELTAPEIADALALNVNTVYARMRAARKAFEQAVARHRARDGWRLG